MTKTGSARVDRLAFSAAGRDKNTQEKKMSDRFISEFHGL